MSRVRNALRSWVGSVWTQAAPTEPELRLASGLSAGGIPLKAHPGDTHGRFREIVSDPLNLLIARDPRAGVIQDGQVFLHNGNRVAFAGPNSYYGSFSDILIINRGVHEPTEEYVFQELLNLLPPAATMLELGAYWGHYSMWLKKRLPQSTVFLVEPDPANIAVGRRNFAVNGYQGEFIQAMVAAGQFTVDGFMAERALTHVDVLHSDIQGSEVVMLDGADAALRRKSIDYVFVSTHSESLHCSVHERLIGHGYIVEVASGYDNDTTSLDGLVFARSPHAKPVVPDCRFFGRLEIAAASPAQLVHYVSGMLR